jgi:hypothetical protein
MKPSAVLVEVKKKTFCLGGHVCAMHACWISFVWARVCLVFPS